MREFCMCNKAFICCKPITVNWVTSASPMAALNLIKLKVIILGLFIVYAGDYPTAHHSSHHIEEKCKIVSGSLALLDIPSCLPPGKRL